MARALGLLATLLAAGYAIHTWRGPNGLAALRAKQDQIGQLEKRNANLAREIEERRARIERLKDSQSQQELEIRQRLKLVKPGEKVFILQDPPSGKPAAE
jgi:cell division protein FtsB